jgi:hypothetical protein
MIIYFMFTRLGLIINLCFKVRLTEYSNFGSNILEFLKNAIEKTYPTIKEFNSNDARDPSKPFYYEIGKIKTE